MAQSIAETTFNYSEVGDNKGYFSSNERRWINHIRRLAHDYPDKCMILKQPEMNGGYIYAQMPTSWLKIRAPRKVELTQEQRTAAAERLRHARESRKGD